MALQLPPYPVNSPPGSYMWTDWYRQLQTFVQGVSSISWNTLDKAGSNLADIQTRRHNDLQLMQGGQPNEYYHLTAAQWASIGPGLTYSSGTWVPVFTGLTVSAGGSYTANGYWTRINNQVSFSVTITATGATTTSSVRGTTWMNTPIGTIIFGGTNSAATRATSFGTGTIERIPDRIWLPTWSLENNQIFISGTYYI